MRQPVSHARAWVTCGCSLLHNLALGCSALPGRNVFKSFYKFPHETYSTLVPFMFHRISWSSIICWLTVRQGTLL